MFKPSATRTLLSSTIALTVASTISLPTFAAGAASSLIEEIQVMARKKSAAESVQDVPLAITAYGGEQLDNMFVKNLTDMSYAAPNVQLEEVGTFPGVQNFTIRGQGINSSIPSVDPTVGTFIDGVYLGITHGAVIDMFDLESVELLRGPQGLLFGRNVTGGAVVLRTARPDGEFGYRARTQLTDHNLFNFAGSIEGTLVEDKLFAKLVAYYNDDQGYFDREGNDPLPGIYLHNPSDDSSTGELKTQFLRPTLVWQATDDLELTLIAESGETTGDGAVWANVTAQQSGAQDEFTTTMDEEGETDMTWDQVTFETNWNVGFGEGVITNILGWRQVDGFSVPDIDGTDLPIFTVPAWTEQDQISNELRYSGTFMDGAWDLTTGLYYFEQDIHYREGRYVSGGALQLALGGDMDHQTWGVFVNNDYHLTENLTLTAGLRFTREEKEAQVIRGGLDGSNRCSDPVTFNCDFDQLEDTWNNWTPKLGFNWHFTESAQFYAFYTKGFRSGGVNFRNAKPDLIPAGPTKEEAQGSFEIGVKSDWMDGRLRLNAAYFYNEVDDMQRELNQGDPDVVVLQATINAGDVTIQGVEVDFVALLAENFSINGSVGYTEGRYTKVDPAFDPYVGTDLPRLSPWTASLGATYDLDLGDKGFLTFRANYSFRDRAAYNDANTHYFDQQHESSASVNYTTPDEHWKLSLFGKNLNDEARWGNLTSIGGAFTAGPMQKGRVWGLEAEYRY